MRRTFPRLAALLIPPLMVTARPSSAQVASRGHASVRGNVTADGRPLAGVLVIRPGTADSTRSDSLGRFAIEGLGAGRHIFEVRKRGFAPIEMEINLPTDTTQVSADIPMESSATADAALRDKLEREGFAARRSRAQERDKTTFLGPAEIAERDAVRVSQLFERARDVTVRFERSISVLYGADGRCTMYVWVDRQLIETAFPPSMSDARGPSSFGGSRGGRSSSTATRYTGLDDLMPISQIGAIEVYPRPQQVPPEFQRASQLVAQGGRDIDTRSAECGAIVIWTR